MTSAISLRTQIEAVQARINALSPNASAEDIVMVAKAIEAVGGRATVLDVIDVGNEQKVGIEALAGTKSDEIVALTDTQKAAIDQRGAQRLGELAGELQKYAAFKGATKGAAGALGMVPAPSAGDAQRCLRADGGWGQTGGIPIGGIALLYPSMAGDAFLPANGGTVKIADYPELYEVLGQTPTTSPGPWIGTAAYTGEIPGYSGTRAAAVSGERVAIVRPSSNGITFSADGGQTWGTVTVGGLAGNGPYWPAISDTGRTVGWVNYNSNATPAQVTFQCTTAASFGGWTTNMSSGGEAFNVSWNSLVVGLPQGVAAIDNGITNKTHVLFKYVQDGAASITREIDLSTAVDIRITAARGALRVGASLYLFVDNGAAWRALLRTDDAGATWTKAWEGSGVWGDHALQMHSSGSFNREDTNQPSYVENGLGIVHTGSQLMLINASGAITLVDQPNGHTLIAGSIHYVNGYYYAASGTAVFRSVDLSAWEQVATASQILGATGTLACMWVRPGSGSFGFYSTLNTLTLVQTTDFVTFRRNGRPSRWATNLALRRMSFTGDRFVWLIVESSSGTNYYDYALFDLVTGRLYANNYFSNQGASLYCYWVLPLPGGRWLHFAYVSSSNYIYVASAASLYSYNLSTEFKLPTSFADLGAVGAYGNQIGPLYDTNSGSRGGYGYYVRAK